MRSLIVWAFSHIAVVQLYCEAMGLFQSKNLHCSMLCLYINRNFVFLKLMHKMPVDGSIKLYCWLLFIVHCAQNRINPVRQLCDRKRIAHSNNHHIPYQLRSIFYTQRLYSQNTFLDFCLTQLKLILPPKKSTQNCLLIYSICLPSIP